MVIEGKSRGKCKIKYNAALNAGPVGKLSRGSLSRTHSRAYFATIAYRDPYARKIVDNLFNLLCCRLKSIINIDSETVRGCLRVRD